MIKRLLNLCQIAKKKNLTDSKLQIQILALFMIIVVIGTSYKIIYLFRFFIISFYWSFPFEYFLWKHDALENENDLTKGRPSIFRRGKDISHLAGGLDLKVWRSCAEGTADDGHGSQHRDWSRQYTEPIIIVWTDLQYFPPTLEPISEQETTVPVNRNTAFFPPPRRLAILTEAIWGGG
jgi:hypothetical protein